MSSKKQLTEFEEMLNKAGMDSSIPDVYEHDSPYIKSSTMSALSQPEILKTIDNYTRDLINKWRAHLQQNIKNVQGQKNRERHIEVSKTINLDNKQLVEFINDWKTSTAKQVAIRKTKKIITEPPQEHEVELKTESNLKYFLVNCKCGHVGRSKYIAIWFPIIAKDAKEAANKARYLPRVKHGHKDAILLVKRVSKEEFEKQKRINWEDPYLQWKSSSEQDYSVIWERLVDETGNNMY